MSYDRIFSIYQNIRRKGRKRKRKRLLAEMEDYETMSSGNSRKKNEIRIKIAQHNTNLLEKEASEENIIPKVGCGEVVM